MLLRPGTWFLSSLFIIRVPFFLLFCFSKGALKYKGQKGTTQGPRESCKSQDDVLVRVRKQLGRGLKY